MILFQINSIVNSGSTGRIAEDIGKVALSEGYESYIAYGRGNRPSSSQLIRIGKQLDVYWHGLTTLLTDRHGFSSAKATESLIHKIDEIKPDVIGLHNLHGYYINIGILFNYLKATDTPVLWTLFDCWAFTGHCSYFDDIQCEKWITHCQQCPKYRNYPKALIDNSFRNYDDKKRLFTGVRNLEILVHSNWLAGLVKKSFLKDYPIHVMPSAIDLSVFKPTESNLRETYKLHNKKIILGCASVWSERKGLGDFIKLSNFLDAAYHIVLIGLNKKQIQSLPGNILGINRTENTQELAQWYNMADVFINPTYQDNFPTTNIEALACGTPVITYNTGGSPEAIDESTGRIVEKGNVLGLLEAINELVAIDRNQIRINCIKRAEKKFNKDKQFKEYLKIFQRLSDHS